MQVVTWEELLEIAAQILAESPPESGTPELTPAQLVQVMIDVCGGPDGLDAFCRREMPVAFTSRGRLVTMGHKDGELEAIISRNIQ